MLPEVKGRSQSELSNYGHFRTMRESIGNQQILNSLIKLKIGSYTSKNSNLASPLKSKKKNSQLKKGTKVFSNSSDFPRINSLSELVEKQKLLYHLYKQKLQMGFQQCFLFFLDILASATRYEYLISAEKIDKERSPLIQTFAFLAQSLFEIGHQKISFFFCVKGVNLCEFYTQYLQMGKFLYLMGKIARKLGKFEHSLIFLKKGLQYLWYSRKNEAYDIEIEVYDQLSHNFLQMNFIDQSKVFAEKYEIGYTEKNNSKIIELSKELVTSVQRRKILWHAITKQSMQLLLSFDSEGLIEKNYQYFAGRVDQKRILDIMKINFEFLWDSFLQDDMFFYEIPLPLELLKPEKPKFLSRSKPQSQRFILKKRSRTTQSLKILNKDKQQQVKQYMIFNYRGVGVCKHKMAKRFSDYIHKLKKILSRLPQKHDKEQFQ